MSAPTSTNNVTARKLSSCITSLWAKIKSTFQTLGNLVTAWGSTPSDTKYPSEKLVKTSLDAKAPNVPSEVTIATGDRPLIADSSDSNKVKRASVTFDAGVPTTYLCRNGAFNAVKEADVIWGGSFRSELSPAEFGNMARNLIHNPITTAITFDKSTDGGATWVSKTISDELKRSLCNLAGSGAGGNFGIPNSAYSGISDPSLLQGRITVYAISGPNVTTAEDTWFYGIAKRILMKVSRNGSAKMKVEYQTWPHFIADDGVWGDVGTFDVQGDIGWNSIPFDNTIGGYSGQLTSGRIIALRFTFWIASGSAPRISIINLGFLPQIHWKSNAGNIPLLGVPVYINDDGTGTINAASKLQTSRKLAVSLSNTSTDTSFNGSADVTNIKTTGTLGVDNGGTGATTAIGAEYNILNQVADIDETINGDRKIALCNQTKSASNGVFRWLKLSNVWTWIKGLLSSESGVNISGNAATATKATQDSDGNAINATYFKSSGNITLVSGTATKIGTQNGADVKLTLPTIPSGTQLVYDCGTGSTSGTDFDNALAAYQAGKWVILHYSSNPYYCVGTYNSGLRFKRLANESSLIKIDTVSWTRGSAPSAGTQLEAALVGHTHTNYVPTSRTINGVALTDNLSAADIGLPSTWSSVSGPTYGIALDEGGIDQSLKNISASTGSMTTDTYFLVHDAIGESSRWYARKINKLWDWVQDKIAAVLRLYTRNNDTPYFDGLAANATSATNASNANISRTADTANGDKLQIGTGTAVNITNAAHAKYADGAGNATNALAADYATLSGKAYEDGNGTTLAPLVVQYNTGSFPDIFNQLEAAYSSKRRIFCKHGLTIAGSTDTVELKIPLSGVRFSSSGSIRTFEFATQLTQRTSSADNAGQTIAISANHLENGSYNWGIAFDWPYHADSADTAGTAGTADTATSATKATQDGNGNNIAGTYAPLASVMRIGNDDMTARTYDLDAITARGFYFINIDSGSNNAPGTGHYTIIVTTNSSGTRKWQVAIGYYMKVRRYTGSAWTAWQTIATMA